MIPTDLQKGITKAAKARFSLICGDEDLLRRRVRLALIEELGMTLEEFDQESILADQRPIREWIASASTIPFLAPYRLLVVRNVLRVSDSSQIEEAIKGLLTLPETGRVILVADEELSMDDQRQQTASRAWRSALTKAKGEVLECKVDAKSTPQLIREEAGSMGKRMSAVAAQTLAEMVGGSYSRAVAEVEKLVLYVGDADEIRESDVRAAAITSREWNVFKLADAIFECKPTAALTQLQILVGSTSKPDQFVNRNIFPLLLSQLRLLWQARSCVDAKCSPVEPPAWLIEAWPDKNIKGESNWRQTRLMTTAKQINHHQLSACMRAIAEADARMKGLREAAGLGETLEMLVFEMIQAVRPASSASR